MAVNNNKQKGFFFYLFFALPASFFGKNISLNNN